MKKRNAIWALVLALFLISSCGSVEDIVPVTLSENMVELPKDASTKVIKVNTNGHSWYAFSNADWLKTNEANGILELVAEANITPEKRSADVMVMTGSDGKKIKVTQAGDVFQLVTFPDKLEVSHLKGEYQFAVETNASNWNATTTASWIKLFVRKDAGVVQISVDANTEKDIRMANITITADNQEPQTYTVSQMGSPYILLPYLKFGASEEEFKAFEKKRGTALVSQPDGLYNNNYWEYRTVSPIYKLVRYYSFNHQEAIAYLVIDDIELFKAEFDNIKKELKDKGFEQTPNPNVMRNEKEGVIVSFFPDVDTPIVIFDPIPYQKKEMPTFHILPMGYAEGVGVANYDAIQNWEKENGGEYVEEASNLENESGNYYYYFTDGKEYYSRSYWMTSEEPILCRETMLLFSDFDKFFYQYLGAYYFTEEFMNLMVDTAFEYHGRTYGELEAYSFYNTARKLEMVISIHNKENTYSGIKSVAINYLKQDAPFVWEAPKKPTKEERQLLKRIHNAVKGK